MGRFGVGLGSIWDRFGIDLGSVWGRFGVGLGFVWARFGAVSGSIWGRFAKLWGTSGRFAEMSSGKVLSRKAAPYTDIYIHVWLVRENSNWKIGPRPSRFEFYVGSPRLSKWLEL